MNATTTAGAAVDDGWCWVVRQELKLLPFNVANNKVIHLWCVRSYVRNEGCRVAATVIAVAH